MPISSMLGSSALLPAGLGFRNKIINGDMRINQRGTGTLTGSGSTQFVVDQWRIWNGTGTVTFQQSTTAPAGFSNSILATVTSTGSYGSTGYTQIQTKIEGFNCQDLAYGSSSAKPITISFWCRSSVVGLYSVQLRNSASNRSYFSTYTINVANTWEYKTILVQGDTAGTWLTNSGVGLDVIFNLGIGSNYDGTANTWVAGDFGSTSSCVDFAANSGATFNLTGVQLEQNIQPTPFEQRFFGIEDILCKRYYQVWSNSSNTNFMTIGNKIYSTPMSLSTPMRTLVSSSTSFVDTVYAQGTYYTLNSLGVSPIDSSRPHYFILTGTFSGSWNYSWPVCTFGTHTCIFNSEL